MKNYSVCNNQETILITRYISCWMWHLISILFLIKGIGFYAAHELYWTMSMFGVVLFCEYMAYTRKGEIENATKTRG